MPARWTLLAESDYGLIHSNHIKARRRRQSKWVHIIGTKTTSEGYNGDMFFVRSDKQKQELHTGDNFSVLQLVKRGKKYGNQEEQG